LTRMPLFGVNEQIFTLCCYCDYTSHIKINNFNQFCEDFAKLTPLHTHNSYAYYDHDRIVFWVCKIFWQNEQFVWRKQCARYIWWV